MDNMNKPPPIDWAALMYQVGATEGRGGEVIAQLALESIIGEENIRIAVEVILDWQPGCEVARSVLHSIRSLKATEMAYREYREGNPDRAIVALGLIADIGHPRSLDWIGELLSDDTMAVWGAGILDKLIWSHAVRWDDERVAYLLALAETHPDPGVREKATYIRGYMERGQ